MNFLTIGARLKIERKRLGITQENFAQIGGIKKITQITYEQDKSSPDATYLVSVSAIGVDVQYVLFGTHSTTELPADEDALLTGYRSLDARGKAGVLGMIEGMRTSTPVSKPPQGNPHVEFHGSVGQQVTGDIAAPQTFHVGGGKKKPQE